MMGLPSATERWRTWARKLKADAIMLWLAARDPDVALPAKALAFLTAAYAFSPIDLIPDFVPVLGLVDDLLIVPAGVWLSLRLIAPGVRERLRRQALAEAAKPVSRVGLVLVIAVWTAAALLVWRWLG